MKSRIRDQDFDPNLVRPGGMGLTGLQERIESLGGGFVVKSSNNGTKVEMFLNIAEMERT